MNTRFMRLTLVSTKQIRLLHSGDGQNETSDFDRISKQAKHVNNPDCTKLGMQR